MEKIKEFLKENSYEFYEMDNLIEGYNEFLHIMIIKREDDYLVRNAIKCHFDRWANSGTEFTVKTDLEVIQYFTDRNVCIPDAVVELVSDLVEDCGWKNDDANIGKMIDYLYSMVNEKENI